MEQVWEELPIGAVPVVCAVPGHGGGHCCVEVPSDFDVIEFERTVLDGRLGRGRTLVLDGFVDPTATERSGAGALAPFGGSVQRMRVWPYAGGWVACGIVRDDEGLDRSVVLFAERPAPEMYAEDGATWIARVVAVTGHDGRRARSVDWSAVEERLGTRLPSDYKELVELFGRGAFDGYLELHTAGAPGTGVDIERCNRGVDSLSNDALCEPYRAYPAPGGLLWWGWTEQEDGFYWLTEGADPDDWPVVAGGVGDDCRAATCRRPSTSITCSPTRHGPSPPRSTSTSTGSWRTTSRCGTRGMRRAPQRGDPAVAGSRDEGQEVVDVSRVLTATSLPPSHELGSPYVIVADSVSRLR